MERDEGRGGGEGKRAGKAVMVGKQGSGEKVESGMRERELLEEGGAARGMDGGRTGGTRKDEVMMREMGGERRRGTVMGQQVGWGTRPPTPTDVPSITLVEPGPVVTDFEGKLLEQVSTAEFPDTDPDTLRYFWDFYLPTSKELFHSVGQSPQDVAQVSGEPRAPRHGSGM